MRRRKREEGDAYLLSFFFIHILFSDYKQVVEKDPKVGSAVEGVKRMEEAVKEKQEKDKEELMGKLKDLGNMVLNPFGIFFLI